jgi:hypothetical protein
VEITGVWCGDSTCGVSAPNLEAAAAAGWREVGEAIYCAVHYYGPYREAKKEKIRAQIEARQRHHDKEVAKKMFSAAEYRAWDQFQSDMADYHKKTGKLAPSVLRTMRPTEWLGEFKEKGRIDIEATAANFEEVKIARGKRTISQLKGL